MDQRPRGIVLMGPPGSGKSFIGNTLARRGIARYVELEPILVKKFGKGSEFLSNKAAALAFIRESYRTQLNEAAGPIAIESTGVSDRAFIEEMVREHGLLLDKIVTAKATCLERVANRPKDLNIGNDVSASARFHDFWYASVEPTYTFAAAVDGTDIEGAICDIAELLASDRPRD